MPNKITLENAKALGVMEEIATKVGTIAYAWGGFIVDIYNNRFEREHDDVEQLVVNLYDHIGKLSKLFTRSGWQTEILENGDLRVKKNGAKMHLGHLELGEKANWYHNGSKGVIKFPKSWLNEQQIIFQNMPLHVVKPEFQYVLKRNPHLMNPEWKHRQKDFEDIKKLEILLKKRSVDLTKLDNKIESIVLS